MLSIDINDPAIINARAAHIRAISCMVNRKMGEKMCADQCEVCKHTGKIKGNIPESVKLKQTLLATGLLNKIIGGEPSEIIDENAKIWKELVFDFDVKDYSAYLKITKKQIKDQDKKALELDAKYGTVYNLLTRVFDYERWFQNGKNIARYDAYELAASLDRNTCTYCNRLYTNTLKDQGLKKVMRPDFDHWFTKTSYPLLALSFYNLIPSCGVCNSSVKLEKTFLIGTHVHPYVNMDCSDRYTYTYHFGKNTKNFTFHIGAKDSDDKLIINTAKDLKLEDVYSAHQAEMNDLLRIREAYSEKYIENMLKNYPLAGLSHKEVFRLAFGAEFDKENFHKLPMSKFRQDILNELKMLDIKDEW